MSATKFVKLLFENLFVTSLTFQVYSRGSGDIASMGTVVTCSMKTYLSSNIDTPVETRDFEQFKIGEGDGVPGWYPSRRGLSLT
jgi:hypothetical protein